MSNIIKAYVYGGKAETEPVYQYDYGQKMIFYKIDLPEAYEVHFANKTNSKTSYIAIGDASGVLVPDEVLCQPGIAYAWLFLHTGADDGETVIVVTIPVIERAGITTIEPTPSQQSTIDELIAALNTAVADCEGSVAHYPKIVDGYWYVWDAEQEIFVSTGVSAHGEQGERGPEGPAGHDGTNGQDGQDGRDGFSPIATVSKVGNTATITITDSSGTTTAEISDGSYENLIDDTDISSVKTWSSSKTSNELDKKMDKEDPTGSGTLSIGRKEGSSSGNYSSAVGEEVIADGTASHAEGHKTTASGDKSHAEGYNTAAIGEASHTEGSNTIATGNVAHAEGYLTIAGGYCSHAEGYNSRAGGYYSHAEGTNSGAYGDNSHAEGYDTIAVGEAQHVFGKYNIEDIQGTYVEIVGNGFSSNNRSNARTLDWDGNEALSGSLQISGDENVGGNLEVGGKVTISGTPTRPNDVARLQDIKLDYTDIIDFPAVSVPHNTSLVNVGYFTLNKGKYLLHAVLRFSGISNGQGRRHMYLSRDMSGNFYGSGYFTQTDSVAIGNEPVFLNEFTMVTIPSNNSPVYIMAFQTNAGQNNIDAIPRVQYCKISD